MPFRSSWIRQRIGSDLNVLLLRGNKSVELRKRRKWLVVWRDKNYELIKWMDLLWIYMSTIAIINLRIFPLSYQDSLKKQQLQVIHTLLKHLNLRPIIGFSSGFATKMASNQPLSRDKHITYYIHFWLYNILCNN